ncbi:acyltransferase domain-containing protein [Kutzneria albida]|uniref:PKS/mFAS DH domain-containing protein n=1 Tax=Kutzneria albida DSM 43870 TaxID=1449976 RepID=W5WER1_9PSEU|nr:acyltransferase domain-containing protein [Kutzneria albida]AHH99683.1 hypothetical protein KALB_6323 [Kutzneria albida DSM 43870]
MTTARTTPVTVTEPERVLLLSASTVDELSGALAVADAELLARTQHEHAARGPRLGVVDPTEKRLAMARKIVPKGRAMRGRNDIWFSPEPLLAGRTGGVGFVFPGLEAEFAPRVDDVADLVGLPVPDLGTQTLGRHGAAVLGVGRVLDAALRRLGIEPDAVAGHSVGEWTAMIAGGLFSGADFDEMLTRTDLDALQVPGVEFAVLGCPADRAAAELVGREDLVISHENSTNQTVVCGPADQVDELVAVLRAQSVICQLLPFRSGFHTPMLAPYLKHFEDGVPGLRINPARVPVWSATTGEPFPSDVDTVRQLCVRHLLEPVRFRSVVLGMHAAGVRAFVQVGPGQLGTLIDDTLRDHEHLTVAANSAQRKGIDQLRRVATALWAEAGNPDFGKLRQSEPVGMGRLREFGSRLPVLAQLDALIAETESSVAAVLAAAERGPAPQPVLDSMLRVSTGTMPYLLDHCFAAQRPNWPDEDDLRPVVPATTVIKHMVDAAARSAPGRLVLGLDTVRLKRWLVASPAVDVPIEVRPLDANRVAVQVGDYADATVVFGDRYEPAAVWPIPAGERTPELSAEQLYRDRWLFHGPSFQGITRSVAISERHMRAEITVPSAPGALLDNVGQVIGQWMAETHPLRWIAFPVTIRRIRFHQAEPEIGSTVDCAVRITDLTEDAVTADAVVSRGGQAAITISGWDDRRFDSGPEISAVHRFPDTSTLAQRRPAGWWLVAERWPTLASREFVLHKYLGATEHEQYLACAPPSRRHWLLERIACKDAVRGWLWDRGAGPLYPGELHVDPDGRVHGRHGAAVPALNVAVAHCAELAVAVIGQRPVIEIAEVTVAALGRKDFTAAEAELLDRSREATGDGLAEALARFATACSVAERAGLPDHSAVHTELVGSPHGLPARQYVVAWTTSAASTIPKEEL